MTAAALGGPSDLLAAHQGGHGSLASLTSLASASDLANPKAVLGPKPHASHLDGREGGLGQRSGEMQTYPVGVQTPPLVIGLWALPSQKHPRVPAFPSGLWRGSPALLPGCQNGLSWWSILISIPISREAGGR